MIPEKQQELNQHIQAIAEILYQEADPNKITSLEGIEETMFRANFRTYNPKTGFFFLKKTTRTTAGRSRKIKSIIGELPITEKQAIRLKIDNKRRISPYLERCWKN